MSEDIKVFLTKEFSIDKRVNNFKKKKLFSAEIELTNHCTLSCNYCLADSGKKMMEEFSLNTIKPTIINLIDYGIQTFWWSGGETILNKSWYEILKYSKDMGVDENLIFTNGTLLNKENCKKIVKVVDRINFHLDTIFPESFINLQNDKSNSKDMHLNILKGLNNLIEAGFDPEKIRWNITLTNSSFNDLKGTMNYAIKVKKVKTITLIPLYKCGRAKNIFKKESLSKENLKYAFQLRSRVEDRSFLLELGPSEYCKQFTLTTFSINYKGEVYPYVDYHISQGNIFNTNICEILENNFNNLSFANLVSDDTYKNLMNGECGKCIYQKYCFGNPTGTYNNGGSIFDPDPFCWHVNKTKMCNSEIL